MNDPALLELFNCLRKAGLSLGLAEYNLLLQAIDAGFGTRDRDALAQLCCALWVKSKQEEQIFQEYFDQIIPNKLDQIYFKNEAEDTNLTTAQNEKPISGGQNKVKFFSLILLGLMLCIAVLSGTFFLIKIIIKPENESRLMFSGFPFFTPVFTANTSEKVARIKITRTGDKHGRITAKLNVGKKCLPKDSNEASQETENSPVMDTTQNIEFKNGEGEITILIPILNNEKADVLKSVELCLTEPQGRVKLGERNRATLTIQNDDYLRQISQILEVILIPLTCMILLPIVWKIVKIRQTKAHGDEGTVAEIDTNLPKTVLSPEVIRTMTDEIQSAQTIRQSDSQVNELFPLIVNDLPVTHRQMKQGWRYLRQVTREGAPIDLDLEATIQQVTQEGFLLNPVLVPPRINRMELLLLIDQDGSMVPFHHLSQALADTALRGGRFNRVRVYYFHNCPDDYLYRDPYHTEAEPIDDCLLNLPKARTVCLIFSDAGAARGTFSSKRRRLTKFFLKQLRQHVCYVAWLNPVPRKRWETTTAHDIAALVPMFEVNRQEFYRAIDALRGRHQSVGEVLR